MNLRYRQRLTTAIIFHKRYAGLPIDILIDHKKQLSFNTQDTGGERACKKISIGKVR